MRKQLIAINLILAGMWILWIFKDIHGDASAISMIFDGIGMVVSLGNMILLIRE